MAKKKPDDDFYYGDDDYEEEVERPLRKAKARREEEFDNEDIEEDYDDDQEEYDSKKIPSGLKIACIVWITYGCLMFINALLNMTFQFGGAKNGNFCGVACIFLFAIVFVSVGKQTMAGKAKDTLGNGIGSIVFSLLNLGAGIFATIAGIYFAQGNDFRGRIIDDKGIIAGIIILGILNLILGAALMTAGILALNNRTRYKRWRKTLRSSGRKKKIRRREED